ncbi:hypothetical protein HF329_32020 [Chitinophaga oryzae]|uniref:RHS repeat-associated core domain-containing protein n=1 Tax=Chitinophaga oryzae TaxID=2725414 RepID=A0AAE6ZNZ9_9BACT|nr:RHS repeat-associated core domain-containing protein [Chitinophaga oryzae]QJB35678.1 hypothetical protein HF329_32020 [Chitinophaga oryzae]
MKGEGNQQDYGFRIYDPRIAKFLSVDPLTKSYPELTPYQFASNSPLVGIDLDGKELRPMISWLADKAKAAGQPRLSGFIRSFGGGDVQSDIREFVDNVGKGNIGGAALQLYGYTATGMMGGMLGTTRAAVSGDKEAQGELIGIGVQALAGKAASKVGGVAEVKTGGTFESSSPKRASYENFGSEFLDDGAPMIERFVKPRTLQEIFEDPHSLEYMTEREVRSIAERTEGWKTGGLGKGKNAGKGLTVREYNPAKTDFTHRYIQYHPGTERHFNGKPYWKISGSKNGGSIIKFEPKTINETHGVEK